MKTMTEYSRDYRERQNKIDPAGFKEKNAKKNKALKDKNPIMYAENHRAAQNRYMEENAEKQRELAKQYYYRTRDSARAVLGNSCCKCGFSDSRTLQIDHINGGGNKTRTNSYALYKWIINNPEEAVLELQLLCANCNWIKAEENRERYSH